MNGIEPVQFYKEGYSVYHSLIREEGITILQEEIEKILNSSSKFRCDKIKIKENPLSIENLHTHQFLKMFLEYPCFKDVFYSLFNGLELKPYYSSITTKINESSDIWFQNRFPTNKTPPILGLFSILENMEIEILVVPYSHTQGKILDVKNGEINIEEEHIYCKHYKSIKMTRGDCLFFNPNLIRYSDVCNTDKNIKMLHCFYSEDAKK